MKVDVKLSMETRGMLTAFFLNFNVVFMTTKNPRELLTPRESSVLFSEN